MESCKRTSLYELHRETGARLIDFGGWEMPVSYSSVLKEHEAVRTGCGLFDVSHMGEVLVEGPHALAFCEWVTINSVSKLAVGQGQYTAFLNEDGGMIDDLIIYRVGENSYLLCINAGNTDKDVSWLERQVQQFPHPVQLKNESANFSQLAIQGPLSQDPLLAVLSPADHEALRNLPYTGILSLEILGEKAWVARTGYTGEKGYELYGPHTLMQKLWREWVLSGKHEVTPCGLGARDTLRLEACYPLYGNEMDDSVNPYEIGIGWATKLTAKDFIGKKALVEKNAIEPQRTLVAFRFTEKGVPRAGMDVIKDGAVIGSVTSGSHLPTLGFPGGLALVSKSKVAVGDEIAIDVRGKIKLAVIEKKPLYSARVK